jgi:hypothetical protein
MNLVVTASYTAGGQDARLPKCLRSNWATSLNDRVALHYSYYLDVFLGIAMIDSCRCDWLPLRNLSVKMMVMID